MNRALDQSTELNNDFINFTTFLGQATEWQISNVQLSYLSPNPSAIAFMRLFSPHAQPHPKKP